MKVLVAEDDRNTREALVEILAAEGYTVIAAENGLRALELFRLESPQLVLLDVMMPGESGYEVCRRIRARSATVPVIFVSAKGEEIDKVLGLELGADDFVVKPFGVQEVLARIRAVTRRSSRAAASPADAPFEIGDLRVVPAELRAYRGGQAIRLTARDVRLLAAFAAAPGTVLDRDTLFDAGWGIGHLPNSRTLDQHISQLRKRIERDPKEPRIIRTVHTAGYRYEA
jgi:DNA-binding response OmpR family regulator